MIEITVATAMEALEALREAREKCIKNEEPKRAERITRAIVELNKKYG